MEEFITKKELEKVLQEYAYEFSKNVIFCTKKVLTEEEAARYMGVSMSLLRTLMKRHDIPHYMPEKGKYYYERVELERWLMSNKVGGQSI